MAISSISASSSLSRLYDSLNQRRAQSATASDDPREKYAKRMQELKEQLQATMREMRRIEAGNASPEQKATQIQTLNAQLASIQGKMAAVMSEIIREQQQSA